MSIFNDILSKIGIGEAANKEATGKAAPPAETTPNSQAEPAPSPPTPTATPTNTFTAINPVDVAAKLDAMASDHPEKLNWKVSIVDLMKLIGLDSSLATRKKLATELGCPSDKMSDSAQMNMWLHKAVLQKLADNGGYVPMDLLT
ncbi:MAG TPA: DUF3597 domain-containing protein [Noviherbaspirillum sp.]|nr:DUF3597 domain-containing protein [Noviherbaspirillum sp.]